MGRPININNINNIIDQYKSTTQTRVAFINQNLVCLVLMANLFNLSHKLYQSLAENCKIYFLGKVFAPVVKHWIMNYFPAVLKMCDESVNFYFLLQM